MKILQIHTSMSGGGIQSVVCNLANELALKDQDITVCSVSKPKPNDVFWNKLNQKIKKETLGKQGGGFSLSIIFQIYKFIKKGEYDIVHIHGFFCYYMFSVLLLHNKIKFAYTLHSDAYMENGKWDQRFLYIKKYFFKKKWILPITISHESQKSFRELYKCDSELVYNGIPRSVITNNVCDEIKQYRFTSNTQVFIHVGRIDTPKNQVVLCNVFQRLIKEGHDIVLLIVGGVTTPSILTEMQPLFGERIIYLGSRNDVPLLLSQCDAMCLPSIWEGLPIVMLEAMSVGCIPICSPVGGIINVLTNNENGILSKSSDFKDYYDAMVHFIQLSNEQRQSIKERALSSFENYTVEIMAKNYLKAYEK